MRARDLSLHHVFGSERTLVVDAAGLALLRKELIETLGLSGARGILTRFGHALGRRTAEALASAFDWEAAGELERAGQHFLALLGWIEDDPTAIEPDPAHAVWGSSFESEAHLLHLGRASEPVCWTLAGFASGYSSFCHGREVVFIEDECRAKGDPHCSVVGRPREEWGDRLAAGALSPSSLGVGPQRQQEVVRAPRHSPSGFVAQSRVMRRVLDTAERVARVDTTALLIGERGVGKERVARILHEHSDRREAPFVPVTCGALPESLLESELFGHRAGALHGAVGDRAGLFEAADGGTLFLDEILELSPVLQLKLLRTLDTGRVWRMGETEERSVNVRVLAGTDREILADVSSGRFREELFHRLRVVEIRIPPLRERLDDVVPLARMFLIDSARRLDRAVLGVSSEAVEKLIRYDWPGNVSELSNAIERAVVLVRGPSVEVDDLPEEIRDAARRLHPAAVLGETRTLADVEREHILATLRAAGGNKTRAAEMLGIATATLFRKLAGYQKQNRRR